MTTYILARSPDLPTILPVAVIPLMPSERVMLAYHDPDISMTEFEAIVREIYGDGPFEDEEGF